MTHRYNYPKISLTKQDLFNERIQELLEINLKLKEENTKLKHDFNELKEKARDFIRAIAYAPTRVVDFFKSLFKKFLMKNHLI